MGVSKLCAGIGCYKQRTTRAQTRCVFWCAQETVDKRLEDSEKWWRVKQKHFNVSTIPLKNKDKPLLVALPKQSKRMSFVESVVNVVVGFLIATVANILVFPLFGIQASFGQSMSVAAVLTVVSIARSYILRRIFNAIK